MRHDPVMHSADIFRVVGIAEQPPFGERDGLAVRGGEIRVVAQSVRLVHETLEGLSRRLVITVRSDDVDDVVARIALRPRNRVPPPRRREVETQARARNAAHRGDDPPPVGLPRLRIGRAPAGVGLPVHLPAGDEDRVARAGRHQPPREGPVVPVEHAPRPRAQQRGEHRPRQPRLVRGHHRDVDHQHPAGVGLLPARPRRQQLARPLDVVPVVARQVGAADGDRGAEPALERAQPGHALPARAEKGPQRHVGRGSLGRPELRPGREYRRDQRDQHDGRGQNGREWTKARCPFPLAPGVVPGWMDNVAAHAYRMPWDVRREKAAGAGDGKIYHRERDVVHRNMWNRA
ncbi:Uncharacterised protein [Actinomadura madurae]|nr:Uncharacterised protein [Actinomadura madurae]